MPLTPVIPVAFTICFATKSLIIGIAWMTSLIGFGSSAWCKPPLKEKRTKQRQTYRTS